MSKFTAGLNAEQRKAVETIDGPLLVLAGAGTGKTRVITHRIAHMLARGIPAKAILAMTFTNKAAGEMKERIAALVPRGPVGDLTVGTFHAFCVKSLRQYGDRVGIRRNFGICDADDQLVAMKQALRQLQIPETTLPPRVGLSRISLLKNRMVLPSALVDSEDDAEATIGRLYQQYNAGLRISGVLDFDDLLLTMVKLLQDAKTGAAFQKRYRYIFVDEYQDTNGPQYEIVRCIGGGHRNVCVVGDDDQSIYGWRGADVSKILNFEKDFSNPTVVRLETNYRSTEQIIHGANAVIRNNRSRHDKALRSAAGEGEAINVRKLPDEEREAEFVVEDILQRVRDHQTPLSAFAVLVRTAMQPRLFELQLRHYGVPYNLVGGLSFFDRKEVRDVLSYLKLVANPDDELSLLRVINTPPRGVGASSVEKLLAVAAAERLSLAEVIMRSGSFPELPTKPMAAARGFLQTLAATPTRPGDLVGLIQQVIRAVDYESEINRCYPDAATRGKRWEAVTEMFNMAEGFHRKGPRGTLADFLESVALNANDERDKEERDTNRVTLMTLHSAKGLEFDEVYLVGMEEGLLPHAKSILDGDVDEERRLTYVGITRARRRLTITHAESRARYGKRGPALPSRFLYEMHGKQPPEKLLTLSSSAATGAPVPAEKPPTKKPSPTRRRRQAPTRRPPPESGIPSSGFR